MDVPYQNTERGQVDRGQLSKLFNLTDRVAIVTGGTRGIGCSVAEGFVCAGAKVVVASRKADACADTESYLSAMGGDVLGVAAHMGDLDALSALVDTTVARFGGLDIVVNNAATGLTMPLGEFTVDAWNKSYDVNLRGPVFLVQYALPHLTASPHAAVINVVSAGAFVASPTVAMYSGAKAALTAFTRAQAKEWAPLGIRVNALAPGTVDTDMVRHNPPKVQAMMAAGSPMARAAHPDEMIGPALFLASDAGSFVTGQVLLADGGLVSR
jgi:NAD(P)-dependent dehydrogenase (short-subunit alcohol dehydrogenase family)